MKPMEKTSNDLFQHLRTRFSPITIGDENAEVTTDPTQARFFSFVYKENDEERGPVSISIISNRSLKVYFSHDMVESITNAHEWYGFLKELRYFAKQNLLSFDARDIQKDQLDTRDFDFIKKNDGPYKESDVEITESAMYGSKRKSMQQFENATLVVYHKQTVDEEKRGARSRHIDSIFIESNHERFRFPINYLNGARAMAVHVSEGGTPYDAIGQHIISTVSEMQNLAKFARMTRRHAMEDSEAAEIRDRVVETYHGIKKDIMRMQNVNNYRQFAETFTPAEAAGDTDVTTLQEKFTRKVWNEQMNDLLPSVQRALAATNESEEKLDEAYVKTAQDAIETLGNLRKIGKKIETGQDVFDGNLANMYANDVYDVVSWIENNLDTSNADYQKVVGPVIELRKKAKSMEREPGSGKNARFGNEIVNTLYPLMQWIQMNNNNVNEAADEAAGTYMKQWYSYSDNWGMLELYINGELVDKWDDYFHSNETGNPLQAKFIEMAQSNGVDPIGLKVIDGSDGDEGVFTERGVKWNSNVSENLGKGMKKFKRWYGTDPRDVKDRIKKADPEFRDWVKNRKGKLGGPAELQRRLANKVDEARPGVETAIKDPNFVLVLKQDPSADDMIRKTKFTQANGLLAFIMSDIASRAIGDNADEIANFASQIALDVGDEGESFGTRMTPEYKKDKQLAMMLAKKYLDDIKRLATDPDYADVVRKDPSEVYGQKKKRAGGYHEAVEGFENWADTVMAESLSFATEGEKFDPDYYPEKDSKEIVKNRLAQNKQIRNVQAKNRKDREAANEATIGTTGTVGTQGTAQDRVNPEVVKALSGGDAKKAQDLKRVSDKLARGQKLSPNEQPVAAELAKSIVTTKKPNAAKQALAQDKYTEMDEAWGKEGENRMFMGAAGQPYDDEGYEGASVEDIASTIIWRMKRDKGLIQKIFANADIEQLMDAVYSVAEFHEGAEELGSSDISIMIKQVLGQLGISEGIVAEKQLKVTSDTDDTEEFGLDDEFAEEDEIEESEDDDMMKESLSLLKKYAGL